MLPFPLTRSWCPELFLCSVSPPRSGSGRTWWAGGPGNVLLSPFPMQDALQTRKKNSSPVRKEFGQDKYQLLPKAMPGAGCAEVARCARWVSRAAVTAPRFPAPAQESLPASDVPSHFPSSAPPRSQSILPKPCQLSRNGLYQGPRTRQLASRGPAQGAGCARDAIYFLVIAVRS